MKLRLVRQSYEHDGIFGTLYDDSSGAICVTLEHAYPAEDGTGGYAPKLQNGEYICVRGMHRLHDLKPFETFEIEGVKGHDNILFHAGNLNDDSNGCVLVGEKIEHFPKAWGITASRITFKKLMDKLQGLNTFTLIVE
jgi:Family of unknown function (DUF5675)